MKRRAALRLAGLALLALPAACARARVAPERPPARAPAATPVPPGHEETGIASWYGHPYHGRRTASGEVYDMEQMTAAHPTLPFGTLLLVENRLNGQTVEVRVTDRGPFVAGRILDLSRAAARALGAIEPGTIPVRLRVIGRAGGAAGPPAARYTVQVASFVNEHRARALARQLQSTWPAAEVHAVEVEGRILHRVRVGSGLARPRALALARELAAGGWDVVVVPE